MKNFLSKIFRADLMPTLFVLVAIVLVSVSGVNVFIGSATQSHLGTAANNLVVGGGALVAVDSVTNGLIVQTGNVGIGTASPTQKLHVNGNILAQGSALYLLDSYNSIRTVTNVGMIIQPYGTTNPLTVRINTGNVGIGISNPNHKLHVDGGIYTSQKSYISGGLDVYSGDLFIGGKIKTYFDIEAYGNLWGTCEYIAKTISCTSGWALLCDEGQFMRGIHNLGGSNTCFDAIYCCQL